jgi:hypothetical protein
MSAEWNGVPLSEVERRCRPLLGESYDNEEIARVPEEAEFVELLRSMRSRCGFLAFAESLPACVAADAATCAALNVTSSQLLAALRALLLSFESTAPPGPFVTRDVAARIALDHIPVTSTNATAVNSSLIMTRIVSRGFQRSPFVNLDTDTPDSAWNVEYHLLNTALSPGNVTLKIGGHASFGALQFIEQFQFFGGGGGRAAMHAVSQHSRPPVLNEYRLDPAIVLAVLTGEWSASAKQAYVARLDVERALLAPEIEAAERETARCAAVVQEREAALEAARGSDDAEQIELAELELDEAQGELLFVQQTLDFVKNVRMTQLNQALAAIQ